MTMSLALALTASCCNLRGPQVLGARPHTPDRCAAADAAMRILLPGRAAGRRQCCLTREGSSWCSLCRYVSISSIRTWKCEYVLFINGLLHRSLRAEVRVLASSYLALAIWWRWAQPSPFHNHPMPSQSIASHLCVLTLSFREVFCLLSSVYSLLLSSRRFASSQTTRNKYDC